jgi:hypothetical protein
VHEETQGIPYGKENVDLGPDSNRRSIINAPFHIKNGSREVAKDGVRRNAGELPNPDAQFPD